MSGVCVLLPRKLSWKIKKRREGKKNISLEQTYNIIFDALNEFLLFF